MTPKNRGEPPPTWVAASGLLNQLAGAIVDDDPNLDYPVVNDDGRA